MGRVRLPACFETVSGISRSIFKCELERLAVVNFYRALPDVL